MCDLEDQTNPIIESHYLETREGLFFAVKGLVHPPDRFQSLRFVMRRIREATDTETDVVIVASITLRSKNNSCRQSIHTTWRLIPPAR